MITCRLSNVKKEEDLLAVLDSLASRHGVRVWYLQPCFPLNFDVCIDGRAERLFQSDLKSHATEAGWGMKEATLALFHNPVI